MRTGRRIVWDAEHEPHLDKQREYVEIFQNGTALEHAAVCRVRGLMPSLRDRDTTGMSPLLCPLAQFTLIWGYEPEIPSAETEAQKPKVAQLPAGDVSTANLIGDA